MKKKKRMCVSSLFLVLFLLFCCLLCFVCCLLFVLYLSLRFSFLFCRNFLFFSLCFCAVCFLLSNPHVPFHTIRRDCLSSTSMNVCFWCVVSFYPSICTWFVPSLHKQGRAKAPQLRNKEVVYLFVFFSLSHALLCLVGVPILLFVSKTEHLQHLYIYTHVPARFICLLSTHFILLFWGEHISSCRWHEGQTLWSSSLIDSPTTSPTNKN